MNHKNRRFDFLIRNLIFLRDWEKKDKIANQKIEFSFSIMIFWDENLNDGVSRKSNDLNKISSRKILFVFKNNYRAEKRLKNFFELIKIFCFLKSNFDFKIKIKQTLEYNDFLNFFILILKFSENFSKLCVFS